MLGRLFGTGGSASVPSVDPVEAQKRLTGGQGKAALIDVREPGEYARGHAKGARNIPLSQLSRRVNDVPADRDVLLICQSGHRSMQAAHILQQHGLTRVTNVSGGTTVWKMHRLPME
jgi:rhodanese-related sulfurtransferase